MQKLVTVFGTRPEIIRLSRILPKLDEYFDHITINTMQNNAPNLNRIFMEHFNIEPPKYNLDIDHSNVGNEIADIISQTYGIFEKERPDKILILGDTYSGLCSIPASRLGIKIFHMEAGMRSNDFRMPEETNRRIIDHISTYNLPYTEYSRQNLIRENIDPKKIFVTGNPIFEVLEYESKRHNNHSIIGYTKYYLATIHRHENVSDITTLKNLITTLEELAYDAKVVLLCHPRLLRAIGDYKLKISENIIVKDSLGFPDFLDLQRSAQCVLTDSGTVPEECAYHKVPCVSLRSSNERPELIESGQMIVSGSDPNNILKSVELAKKMMRGSHNFDMNVSDKVVKILRSVL